jgi:hypothetical protein
VDASKFWLRQIWDDRVEIGGGSETASAVYQFNSKLPKSCVHPLVTAKGHQLSGFEMSDHIWHRGLWFTIKFINGSNFWEERPPFGIQVARSQPLCEMLAKDAVRLTYAADWNSDATGTVLSEKRAVTFRFDQTGIGVIDWDTELQATQDLVLDRTPYTTWGGYGGLAFRGSRELHDASYLLPNGEARPAVIGERQDWVVLQAAVDGGAGERVSLGMMDHPANPRGQSPWYCRGEPGYILMNAAFLFHEPMTFQQGQTLRFRYRILYRDGLWNAEEFAALATAFRAT